MLGVLIALVVIAVGEGMLVVFLTRAWHETMERNVELQNRVEKLSREKTFGWTAYSNLRMQKELEVVKGMLADGKLKHWLLWLDSGMSRDGQARTL